MQWVGRVVAERHVEQHLTAVMIRRWLEGLSRRECNFVGQGSADWNVQPVRCVWYQHNADGCCAFVLRRA